MSTNTSAPLPPAYQQTPQQASALNAETNLMNTQSGILGQEQAYTRATMPYMFSSMGLNPQFDSNGNLTSLSGSPAWMTNQQNLQTGFQNRTLNALNGGVNVDPYLKQQLDLRDQAALQGEYNTFGTNPLGSTGGQTSESLRNQTYLNTLEEARRGDLTMAENLALANQGGMQGTLGMIAAPGTSNYQTMQSSSVPGQTMGQIYGQGLQQQQLGMQYGLARNQVMNDFWGQFTGAGGSMAGAAIAAMFL